MEFDFINVHTVLLVLTIIGTITLPYGIYEIWKGSGTVRVKAVLTAIVIVLFIVETLLSL